MLRIISNPKDYIEPTKKKKKEEESKQKAAASMNICSFAGARRCSALIIYSISSEWVCYSIADR